VTRFYTVQGKATDLPCYVQAENPTEARTKVENVVGIFSRLAPPPIIKEIAAEDLPEDVSLF
jgi:aspartokinase-like uncharacterized kinase